MLQGDRSSSHLPLLQKLWVCKIHKPDFRMILNVRNAIFWSISLLSVQFSEYSSINPCEVCFSSKVTVLIAQGMFRLLGLSHLGDACMALDHLALNFLTDLKVSENQITWVIFPASSEDVCFVSI